MRIFLKNECSDKSKNLKGRKEKIGIKTQSAAPYSFKISSGENAKQK